jgi:hypothetical protein
MAGIDTHNIPYYGTQKSKKSREIRPKSSLRLMKVLVRGHDLRTMLLPSFPRPRYQKETPVSLRCR